MSFAISSARPPQARVLPDAKADPGQPLPTVDDLLATPPTPDSAAQMALLNNATLKGSLAELGTGEAHRRRSAWSFHAD